MSILGKQRQEDAQYSLVRQHNRVSKLGLCERIYPKDKVENGQRACLVSFSSLAFAHMHMCVCTHTHTYTGIHEYVQTHACTELSYQSISLKQTLSARKVTYFSPKGQIAVPGDIFGCQLTRFGGNHRARGQGIVTYFTKNKDAHCPTCAHQRISSLGVFSAKIEKPWLRKKLPKLILN